MGLSSELSRWFKIYYIYTFQAPVWKRRGGHKDWGNTEREFSKLVTAPDRCDVEGTEEMYACGNVMYVHKADCRRASGQHGFIFTVMVVSCQVSPHAQWSTEVPVFHIPNNPFDPCLIPDPCFEPFLPRRGQILNSHPHIPVGNTTTE